MTMAPDPVSCPGPAGLFLPGLRNGKVLADPLYPMKHLPATQQWPKQGSQTVWKGLWMFQPASAWAAVGRQLVSP